MYEFWDRLKEERRRLKLNQDQMAELGGVTRNSQSNYEKGERKPDVSYLAGIAKAGADILYIITGQRTPIQMSTLSMEETCLIDNYRHSAEEGRKALEATSAAVAKPKKDGKINKVA